MNQLASSHESCGPIAATFPRDESAPNAASPVQVQSPGCSAVANDLCIDSYLNRPELRGPGQLDSQLHRSRTETQLSLEIRKAIHACALEIIATESRCVEWGAPAYRSVELAEEAITNIVSLAVFSSHALPSKNTEAVFGMVTAAL